MAELGLVLVGFVCGVIFGIFVSAIIAASSTNNENIYENGTDMEIVDKLEDGRYLVKITRRK